MLYTTMVVKDKEYKLRISAKSCVDLEKKLGENPLNVLIEATNANKIPTLSSFLTILHAAIQQYQHGITLDDVYNIYDEFVDEGHNITDLVPIIYEVVKVSGYCGQAEETKESEAKNA